MPALRVGLVGLGMIVDETYLPAFRQRRGSVEFVAAASRTGRRGEKLLGEWPTLANFAGPDAVQRMLAAGVDAVCVATPDDRHFEPAESFGFAIDNVTGGAALLAPRTVRVQDIDNLSGKVLRIDPLTGAGLADDPFYSGDPAANRSRVYQLGVRNVFRMGVDRLTGTIYLGDVGWTAWEEVNTGGSGANFGWPYYEGGQWGEHPDRRVPGPGRGPGVLLGQHPGDGLIARAEPRDQRDQRDRHGGRLPGDGVPCQVQRGAVLQRPRPGDRPDGHPGRQRPGGGGGDVRHSGTRRRSRADRTIANR
jgi:hypothetical protein